MIFHWLDLIILLILLWFPIRGFIKGISGTLFKILSIFLGILVAIKLTIPLKKYLLSIIEINSILASIASGIILTLMLSMLLLIIKNSIKKSISENIALEQLERIGGLIFGFVKSFILINILLLLITKCPIETEKLKNLKQEIKEQTTLASFFLKSWPRKAPPPTEDNDKKALTNQ